MTEEITVKLKRSYWEVGLDRTIVDVSSHILFLSSDGQKQEVNLGGGASRQCFYDLTPSSQYQISIHTWMQELEGPSVSITDMTRMLFVFNYSLHYK